MRLNGLTRDFDTVIFDFDGTIVDSMWMWTDIDIEYLGRFGIDFRPEIQRDIEGMSVEETAVYFRDVLGVPRSVSEMRDDWIAMTLYRYEHEVKPKPYAREFISLLKDRGVKMGIATSNAVENVRICLKSNRLESFFDVVITSSDVARGKPFPDVYLHAASLLGSDPENCIVFEDIPAGIASGRAAGMETVAVYDDFSRDQKKKKISLADHYISDYGELMK